MVAHVNLALGRLRQECPHKRPAWVTKDEFWASPRLQNELLPQKNRRKERKTVKVLFKCYGMQEEVGYKMANRAPLW